MTTLKLTTVTTVGNATGVVLPKKLTPYTPEVAAQMDVAERVMREDRDVLRKLHLSIP